MHAPGFPFRSVSGVGVLRQPGVCSPWGHRGQEPLSQPCPAAGAPNGSYTISSLTGGSCVCRHSFIRLSHWVFVLRDFVCMCVYECVINTCFSVKCVHERCSMPATFQHAAWWSGSVHTAVVPVTPLPVTLKFCPQEALTHPQPPHL